MGNTKHEKWLKRLWDNNAHFRNGGIKILGEYTRAHDKIVVETKYGVCKVNANSLLKGIMPTIMTAIDKNLYCTNNFKDVHGELYDYSLVKYVKNKFKVKIICKVHGEFEQTPRGHLVGKGCEKCARPRFGYTKKDFLEEITDIYGEVPFEIVEFYNTNKPMIIKNNYGLCKTFAYNLFKGAIPSIQSAINKEEYFINQIKELFEDNYIYDNIKYTNARKRVNLECKKHGKFSRVAHDLTLGKGCQSCSSIIKKQKSSGWKYSEWEKAGKLSENFDSFKVYILECWDENERFYKIGKTFRTLQKRFPNFEKMPYNYNIIRIFEGEAREMSELEHKLQKDNRQTDYKPTISFGGMYECFSKINKETVTYEI